MNKSFAIPMNLVTIIMLVLLTACSSNEAGSTTTNPGNTGKGKELSQGVTDTEILVGQIGPQTGPVAEFDKVRQGAQAYFNYINDNGGVNGRKLKLIAYDDQYQPAQTVQAVKRLIEIDKVFAILQPLGTANISATLPTLEKSGIPVIGIGTGGENFVNPPIKNIFAGQFTYSIETQIFLDYTIKKLNAKNIAVAYQNDDFGKQGLDSIKANVENYDGAKIIAEVPFLATDKEFSSQAQKLKKANPDAIIMLSTPAPAASLRKDMHKIGALDIPYIVSSTGGMDKNQFNLAGKDVWEGVISAHFIDDYTTSTRPENEAYIEYVTKESGEEALGSITQESWARSQAFVEALKRAEDDLNWDNFLKQMETIKNWEGSLYRNVTFSAKSHYGNTSLFLIQAKDGELNPITDYIYFNPETREIEYN